MMYNKLLDTFLTAAECESFTKAAERLHISSTAVVKQINLLEDEVGIRLFQRTRRGILLTEAGQAFQTESLKIIALSQDAILRVQRIEANSTQQQIRLGTALLRPAGYFLHLWSKVYRKSLAHRIQIVPFLDNSYTDYVKIVRNLGGSMDIIATVYPPELCGYRCSALEITRLPFCCAVPAEHPLAEKNMLEVKDLCGESVIILRRGLSSSVDEARGELENFPDITLIDTSDYEPSTLNQCNSSRQLLLTLDCWAEAHPMLKTISINWSFGTPYGLLYSQEPSESTREFIAFIRRTLKNAKGGRSTGKSLV